MQENYREYRIEVHYTNTRTYDAQFHKNLANKVSQVLVKLDENGNFNENTAEFHILEQLGLSKKLKFYGTISAAYKIMWHTDHTGFAVMRRFKYEKTKEFRGVLLGLMVTKGDLK